MFPVYIGVATNENDFYKEVEVLGGDKEIFIGDENLAATLKIKDKENRTNIILCIDKKKVNKNELYETIVHECVHICDFIYEEIGAESPDTEIRAYMTQWLFQEVCDII
jgi:hypothetical protein